MLPIVVNASTFPHQVAVGGSFNLIRNEAQNTNIYSKETWVMQRFKHVASSTTITNPCPNCQLAIKLVKVDDNGNYENTFPAIYTVSGEEKDLQAGSVSQPGNYRLTVVRKDFTLVNTTAAYNWKIDFTG